MMVSKAPGLRPWYCDSCHGYSCHYHHRLLNYLMLITSTTLVTTNQPDTDTAANWVAARELNST